MNCRYMARSFAKIGARSSRYIVAFFLAASQSSRACSQQRANSQTSNLPPNPHILTRHRSTAELRVVGIKTSRTESHTEEPSPESNDLAMSCLRTRETITNPCARLAPSLNVCTSTRKKRNCCTAVHSTAVIAHGFWAHIGSIPWATSNRLTSCLLYTSPSPRDLSTSRMPSSA